MAHSVSRTAGTASAHTPLSNPIIVALDVDSREACLDLVRRLHRHVGAFKLGPRLLVRYGAALVSEIAALGPVFVDNKYLDIPSTMEHAIRASFEAGASLATIHAWSGAEALRRLSAVERELNEKRPFQILAVTVLTSFDRSTLPPPLDQHPILDQVLGLSDLVLECGLKGLVCSPEEASELKKRHPNSFLVTPGIRFQGDESADQKRVMGPAQALLAGADALVIGRSIIGAGDPVAAAERCLHEISTGWKSQYEKR